MALGNTFDRHRISSMLLWKNLLQDYSFYCYNSTRCCWYSPSFLLYFLEEYNSRLGCMDSSCMCSPYWTCSWILYDEIRESWSCHLSRMGRFHGWSSHQWNGSLQSRKPSSLLVCMHWMRYHCSCPYILRFRPRIDNYDFIWCFVQPNVSLRPKYIFIVEVSIL